MLRIEAPQRVVGQLTIGERAGRIGRDRHVDRRELDLDHAAFPPADEVEAGVDEQSMEPGVETLRIAETGEVAPGSNTGFLDRVARELRVPDDQSGGRV